MELRPSMLLLVLGICLVIFIITPLFLEKSLIYYPSRRMNSTLANWGLQYEDIYFQAADGTRLNGWYVPLGKGEMASPLQDKTFESSTLVTLWLHANAHNISEAYDGEMMALIQRHLKTNLFIFDYRGYGRSEGEVSESGTYSDARGALDYLRERGVAADTVILFGHSLGSAVAVDLAAENTVRGLILWSPFTSVADIARYHYPILGHFYTLLPWLPGIKYDSISKIGSVGSPLLIIHGHDDMLVPLSMGKKLYDEAKVEKKIVVLRGADHNRMSNGEEMLGAIDSFVRKLGRGEVASPLPDLKAVVFYHRISQEPLAHLLHLSLCLCLASGFYCNLKVFTHPYTRNRGKPQ